jgi:HEAT repeat protein
MYPSPWLRLLLLGAVVLPAAVRADEPNPDPKRIQRQVRERLAALESANTDAARAAAVRELGRLGPAARRAVPALAGLLKDRSPQVRLESAFALLKIDQARAKEAFDALAALLEDKEAAPYHIFLVVYMKDIRPASKEAVAGSLALVRHKNPLATVAGCIALDNLGPQAKDATDMLERALKDDNVLIRTRAALGLARIDPQNADRAVPVLRQALEDRDFDVRHHAAVALLEIDRTQLPAVTEALAPSLKDPSLNVRLGTVEFLLEYDPVKARAALPVLVAALGDKDPKTRLRVVKPLIGLGAAGADVEKELRAHFKDPDAAVAAAAVGAVMRLQPERAEVLFPLLASQRDRRDRTGVADLLRLIEQLHKIEAAQAGEALLKSLTEQLRKKSDRPHGDLLRLDAALRLADLGPRAKAAVGDLVKALDDPAPLVRSQAGYALGRVGPEAKPAAGRLAELYKDRGTPPDLRQTIATALKKIVPDTAKDLGIR